jgi:DNA-binding transcriptional LysR family regulator
MELRHLRYFVAVADAQSITRAAEQLHVSQPPLSRQIRDLEDELGVPLFERAARRVTLTAAGRVFLRDARFLLQRADESVRRVRTAACQTSGELRIGYSPLPTLELLPRTLKVLRKTAPQLRVNLLDLFSDEILQGVAQKTLDLALIVQPAPRKDRGLVFESLGELPIGIIVAPDHPFARRRSVTMAEALGEPLVAYIRRGYSDYHHWLHGVLQTHPGKTRIAAQVDGSPSLFAAVQAGHGIAFGPPQFVTVAGGRVRYIRIHPAAPPLRLGVAYRPGPRSPRVETFLEAVRVAAKAKTGPTPAAN